MSKVGIDRKTLPSATTAARPPLGLPRGSIRALLTLLIVAVVIVQIVRGRPIDLLWTETLAIALAHYFTSRRFVELPREALRRLEEEGLLHQESNPLYLPRHSIRILIVLAFAVLAGYLHRAGRLFESQAVTVLALVASYLVGVIWSALVRWWTRGRKTPAVRFWDDLKAVTVLLVMIVTAAAYLLDRTELIPQPAREATLALVLFYFGSR